VAPLAVAILELGAVQVGWVEVGVYKSFEMTGRSVPESLFL